jgi:hypothetical protein
VGEVVDAFQKFFCSSSSREALFEHFFRNFLKFFWQADNDLRHAGTTR